MKSARLFPTAYQNLWHACVPIYFSVTKDEMFAFPSRNASFRTPFPFQYEFSIDFGGKGFSNGPLLPPCGPFVAPLWPLVAPCGPLWPAVARLWPLMAPYGPLWPLCFLRANL